MQNNVKINVLWILVTSVLALPGWAFQDNCRYLVGPDQEVLIQVQDLQITRGDFVRQVALLGDHKDGLRKSCPLQKRFLDHLLKTRLASRLAAQEGLRQAAEYNQRLQAAQDEILASMFLKGDGLPPAIEAEKSYFHAHRTYFTRNSVRVRYIALPKPDDIDAIQRRCGNMDRDACFTRVWERSVASQNAVYRVGTLTVTPESSYPFTLEKATLSAPLKRWLPEPIPAMDDFLLVQVTEEKKNVRVSFEKQRSQIRRLMREERKLQRQDELQKILPSIK
ncbi:MAG: hypothetical protein OXT67_09275 [Zetaproteobacteria bacterium]|nr:hypothetical protein [Zetaproteobacteria bacterium]